jgi:hypothetical protein
VAVRHHYLQDDIAMTSSTNPIQQARPRFRWRRWLLRALIAVLVLIGITIGQELWARRSAQSELDKTVAELDQSDPRWRIGDIEADRVKVPDDRNSALIIVAAYGLLPPTTNSPLNDEVALLPPALALGPDLAARLAADLKWKAAAAEKARTLKAYPQGRHALQYSADLLSTMLRDQASARHVAILLELDGLLFLHNNELEKAVNSNCALLNSGRSLGDEPILISMLNRMGIDGLAMRNIQRILAQGQLDRPQLQERQKAFEEELMTPFFLIGMRGERAGNDHLLTNIETGKIHLLGFLRNAGTKNTNPDSTPWDHVSEFYAFSMVLRSHATLLQFETRLVEAAKLPSASRYTTFKDIHAEFMAAVPRDDKTQILARLLFPAVVKVADAERRVHTQLACAVTGLAAEQFRLQHKHWPASLEELVTAGFLKKIPIDPYPDQPLRFRRAPDGLVIFSVGADGVYDGTGLDDKPKGVSGRGAGGNPAFRIEFRLWDVERRRQAPPPAN